MPSGLRVAEPAAPEAKSSRARRLEQQARLRAELDRRAQRARLVRIAIAVTVGAALLALLVPTVVGWFNRPSLDNVQSFNVPGAQHVQGIVAYAQTPPAGGDHAPRWQNCGFYDQPIQNENAVHSQEHGAVWITYRPDLAAGQVDQIRQLARGQTYVLASSYPDLPAPVVASAWGTQLRLESADDPRLREFVRRFRQGPQTPEPGAVCTGGLGQPR